MWRSRTFWRLFASYSVLWLAAIGLLGTVIVTRVEGHFLQQIEASLRTKAVLLREVVRGLPGAQAATLEERMVRLRDELAARITLMDADGRVVAESEKDPSLVENHMNRPEVQ